MISFRQICFAAVNSIKAAQETYTELQRNIIKDLVLLHGRLNVRDRLAREKELEDRGFKTGPSMYCHR